MKIYVSGLYSGTNPQPGIGIARSLRLGFPEATLIGVEYSNRCSGIHWPDFADIWLQRPWNEIDLDEHGNEIKKILDAGAYWISANDLEIMWLASLFPDGHHNLLTPPTAALKSAAKPAITAHAKLPMQIPTFVTTELPDWELHAFCRQHNWKVWLKGPYYEAVRTRNWTEFQEARTLLSKAWSTDILFLQAHVSGYEESISLSAYKGKLLSCVRMRKRDLTDLSKTWAGDVTEVPDYILNPLRETIKDLNWTGGAELEMVRDADDDLWLLEINPRFPAWIHGGTITGHNLPAKLVEGASGIKALVNKGSGEEFTRVVLEVPVRIDYPLPSLPEPFGGGIGHSLKHPSGLLGFANRLHRMEAEVESEISEETKMPAAAVNSLVHLPPSFLEDIDKIDFESIETPAFLFFEKTATAAFTHATQIAQKLSNARIEVKNAYSIKTNPDSRLLSLACQSGFFAEAISLLEVNKALANGFVAERIILNGPGKWWHKEFLPEEKIYAVFCDSIADLKRTIDFIDSGTLKTQIAGVRLRTPNIASRFGITVDKPEDFKTLVDAIKLLPRHCQFGIHFHMASSNVGIKQWWHLFKSMLRWCASIESLSGRTIEVLDLGGGWFPDDWQDSAVEHLADASEDIQRFLPHVRQIICEPGKALAQPSMAMAMRILEIQNYPGVATDIVVDGSIAELPMYFFYPHRMLHQSASTGEWNAVGRGKTHLLGRLCMEHDVVASNIDLPADAQTGDLIVFCDAGAYDRSMSYVFGRG